jgi:ATP-dependent RNA helicase RhlB
VTHDKGRPERSHDHKHQEHRHHRPRIDSEFDSLRLPEPVLAGVRDAGFLEMTPIQRLALPPALEGRDVCGQAQTGTGKTATFLITIFSRLLADPPRGEDPRPRALVLAPTRELALQIHREAVLLGKHTGLRAVCIYGGEGYQQQEKRLLSGVDLVVGTPGRLLDFARRKVLDLSAVRYLVIDEADRLLDMGFWEELQAILRRLPPPRERQSMLFSATLDQRTKSIAFNYMDRPHDVAVEPERIAAGGVEQAILHVDRDRKFSLLLGLLSREDVTKGMVFANRKDTAGYIVKKLAQNGIADVGLLTGDLRQSARKQVLERFAGGGQRLLVASDVASRGLHIDDVTHIINYDVPQDPEDYVHRIGRTARAGKRGKAFTLACDEYCWTLPQIEELVATPIPSRVPEEGEYAEDATSGFSRRDHQREMRRGSPGPARGGRPGGTARGGRPGGRGGRGSTGPPRGQRGSAGSPRQSDRKR